MAAILTEQDGRAYSKTIRAIYAQVQASRARALLPHGLDNFAQTYMAWCELTVIETIPLICRILGITIESLETWSVKDHCKQVPGK